MSLIALSDRLKPFSSVYNFRDFGGYAGLDGRPVKTNILFRSAHLNNLTEDELNEIESLPVGTVVDLRHAPERKRQPSLWPAKPERAVVLTQPIVPEIDEATVAPHEAFAEHKLYSASDAREYMMNSYGARPHDPGFKALFADTLRRMTDETSSEKPGVIIHCAAGKDRTGTLVALIQGLLGVSHEDIMADYMLTETAVDIDAILVPASKMYSQRYGRPMDPDSLRPMFGVDPDYLIASLEAMGDLSNYAEEVLGFGPEQQRSLRDRYLADA